MGDSSFSSQILLFQARAGEILVGKQLEINLALACLLARGHLLIEDIPGVGKTTLVLTLAKLFGLRYSRIQFTNDLLPADILGSSIYDPDEKRFRFHAGPIFAELVLADELNRASARTQSALLQAMEEEKVSVDGVTHPLPLPFTLIATQNPRQQIGTAALPESQLDRFLMRISLGYPAPDSEKRILLGERRQGLLERLPAVFTPGDLMKMQKEVSEVKASEALIDYLQAILLETRKPGFASAGLSPRAAIQFLQAARAWAYLAGRNYLLPEDIQAVGVPVMAHRLNPDSDFTGKGGVRLAQEILLRVSVDTL